MGSGHFTVFLIKRGSDGIRGPLPPFNIESLTVKMLPVSQTETDRESIVGWVRDEFRVKASPAHQFRAFLKCLPNAFATKPPTVFEPVFVSNDAFFCIGCGVDQFSAQR